MTQTNIPKYRKLEIKDAVFSALQHSKSSVLPIEVKRITRSFKNIRLIPYSKHMKKLNITYEQILVFTETKDACTDYYVDNDLYYIYYNDIDSNIVKSNRYRWNIAHELGHVLLNHHKSNEKTRIFRSSLTSDEYNVFEAEADYFAQLLLVPHAALAGFKINKPSNIRYMCKISDPASKRRYYEFIEWKSHINANDEYDNKIFHYYFNFIYKRKCKNCNTDLIQRYGKYCPICGEKNTLEWGNGTMRYPLLPTHENGKLKECPNCHNEETNINGDYCQICGRNLVNKCSDRNCSNKDILPSNARFCPICGNQSSFFVDDLLRTWDYNEYNTQSGGFMIIPDGIDEELPFN